MKTFFYLLWVILIALISFPIALLIKITTSLFDKKGKILHFFTRYWALLYLYTFPYAGNITVKGKENINPKTTYLIISNHLSLLDIMMGYLLPIPFKWVSKIEMAMIPCIGWNMFLNNYIFIKRGNSKSIKTMIAKCINKINTGSSVYLFPEGTRSKNGKTGNFKSGAFLIAKQTNCAILPVIIRDTHKTTHGSNWFSLSNRVDVKLEILPPIAPNTIKAEKTKTLLKTIQKQYDLALGSC